MRARPVGRSRSPSGGRGSWRVVAINPTVVWQQTGRRRRRGRGGHRGPASTPTTVPSASWPGWSWWSAWHHAGAVGVVGVVIVRGSLRPLVTIEETADGIAAGRPRPAGTRTATRAPRSAGWATSLNSMLAQIETAFRAQSESEADARRSEERMRRFVADASHELRTPLTAIRGFAEYYRQRGGAEGSGGSLPAEDLNRLMRRVEDEAARMGVLVEDLLLLARLDQQRPIETAGGPAGAGGRRGPGQPDDRTRAGRSRFGRGAGPGVPRQRGRGPAAPGHRQPDVQRAAPHAGRHPDRRSGSCDQARARRVGPAVVLEVEDHGPGPPARAGASVSSSGSTGPTRRATGRRRHRPRTGDRGRAWSPRTAARWSWRRLPARARRSASRCRWRRRPHRPGTRSWRTRATRWIQPTRRPRPRFRSSNNPASAARAAARACWRYPAPNRQTCTSSGCSWCSGTRAGQPAASGTASW